MRYRRKIFICRLPVFVFVVMFVALGYTITNAQTSETYIVTSANPQGWAFVDDQGNTASGGSFVNGPGTTPLGTGSANLFTNDASGGHTFGTLRYAGTKLSDMVRLKYSAYGNLSPQAIALQFDVEPDVNAPSATYQGRLVFEPYQAYGNSAVIPNTWIEWDALAGTWWGSGNPATRPVALACPQSKPCTTAELLTFFPRIGIRSPGRLLFKAGSGWSSPFSGNVDKLIIGVTSAEGVNTDTWDFELNSTPNDPEQCKKGGYLLFNPPAGPFKNQGQCVSSAVPTQ